MAATRDAAAGRMAGRVALVTGAGVGIGRAVAVRLAEEGADVVVTSRTAAHAAETARLVAEVSGTPPTVVELDVADRARVVAAVGEAVAAHGRIDVLVANAGIDLAHGPHVTETSDEDWDRLFEVNVGGLFRTVRAVLPHMPDGGSIVTVGSVNSLVAWPDNAAYTASKGAVLQFTRALALDVAPRNVRANCVCPGVIDTPLTRSFLNGPDAAELEREYGAVAPLNRMGTPREIADAVLFLAGPESTFMTGAALVVDGGMTAR